MINGYFIIKEMLLEDLESSVEEQIKAGWQPFGPLIDNKEYWVQVLVAHEKGDKAE